GMKIGYLNSSFIGMTNIYKDRRDKIDCIWMSSKLVKYKLCDRNYDCEKCEFYKVMMNLSVKLQEAQGIKSSEPLEMDLLDKVIRRIENETFDEKIIYLKN